MSTSDLIAAVIFASEHNVLTTDNILDICNNMVVVDEHGHFRFAHLSVREYLECLDTYSTAQCHSFVLQRCLESYLNTSIDWRSQLRSGLDLEIKPYAMLYWPFHCQLAGNLGQDQTLANIADAFIFETSTKEIYSGCQSTKRPSPAFTDWLSDVWNASRYSGTGEYESAVLGKLESSANSSSNPQFFACTFDFDWILDSMKTSGWNDWGMLNHHAESCISLAAKWGSLRTILWLLDGSHVTPEALTDALSVAINQNQHDIAMVLAQSGANGFGKPQANESPLHDAASFGYLGLVRVILCQNQHFKSHVFAAAMCEAFLKSLDKVFLLFWNTYIQLTAPDYFRVLLYIQMQNCSDERVFEDPGKLDDLYQRVFDYMRISESPEIKKIHRLSELLSDSFSDLSVLPNGTFVANECYTSHHKDQMPILDLCASRKIDSEDVPEIIDIILSLSGGNMISDPEINECYIEDEGESRLLLAMCSCVGDWCDDVVTLLLDRGVNIDATDEVGITPLMYSIREGNLSLMKLLLERGAAMEKVDKKGRTALIHALNCDNREAVTALIHKGIDINASVQDGQTPLQIAVHECAYDMIRHLRELGAHRPGSIIHRTGVSVSFLAGTTCYTYTHAPGLLQYSISEQDHQSGVHDIFSKLVLEDLYWSDDDNEQLNASFNAKTLIDVDNIIPNAKSWEDGLTPLQAAICLANSAGVEALLDIPVDVNDVDNQGFSALHYAVLCNEQCYIEKLLSHKADPHLQDRHGRAPLHLAAATCRSRFDKAKIKTLLKATPPSRVDTMDSDGNAALHFAIISGAKKVFSLLLSAGANPHAKNNDRQTPRELALAFSVADEFASILDYGIDVFSDAHQCLFEAEELGDTDIFADGEGASPLLCEYDEEDTTTSDHIEIVLATQIKSIIQLAPWYAAKFLDRKNEDLVTGVDLYNAYDADVWTALDGPRSFLLRPMDAIYRG